VRPASTLDGLLTGLPDSLLAVLELIGLGVGGDPDTLFLLLRLDTILDTAPPPGILGPLASLGPRTAVADCAEPVRLIVALPVPRTVSSGGEGLRDMNFVGDGLADPPVLALVRLFGVGGMTEVTGGGGGTVGVGAGELGISGSSEGGSTNCGLAGGDSSSSTSGGGSLNIGRGGSLSISGGGSLNDGREGWEGIVGGGGGGGVRIGGGGGGGGV
jgi:hypothetical protein